MFEGLLFISSRIAHKIQIAGMLCLQESWGGGAYCGSYSLTGQYPGPNAPYGPVLCTGNGAAIYPFGNGRYVGLGLLTFCTIIFIGGWETL